ncbi:FG-GAP repeat [Carpediemonas membranifera]|uniref:FG-GAP repeat n=1 Tax=Carpediemonas membranifera TaxID=201153 RepID=A0A8J6EAR7_9EUKA|nr:FG-GAP repeat [Carpediemonas membranifera]|eukprot:KAG9395185.1 FG-GAP repeat [Carpediemonas membranifera]
MDETAVIGATGVSGGKGAVYISTKDDSGVGWSIKKSIEDPHSTAGDNFGSSIRMDDEWLIVGSTGYESLQGAVYFYARDNLNFEMKQIVTSPKKTDRATFGYSLDIEGTQVIIGEPYLSVKQGTGTMAAYIFAVSNGHWSNTGTLTSSSKDLSTEYGRAVTLTGKVAFVGAPMESGGTGAVYIWNYDAGTGWTNNLNWEGYVSGEQFGTSIATNGAQVVVGAPYCTHSGAAGGGRVYIYEIQDQTWKVWKEFMAPTPTADAHFGTAVGMYDDHLVIGAPLDKAGGGVGAGVVYIYKKSATDWVYNQRMVPTGTPADAHLGASIYMDDTIVIAGAFNEQGKGAVYTDQEVCPPGTHPTDEDRCVACQSGKWSKEADLECRDADPGYYVPDKDHSKQLPCDNGGYQPNSGQNKCLLTPNGTYTPDDNKPHTKWENCNAGGYQPDKGKGSCVKASPGYFVPADGKNHTAQDPCGMGGKYQDETGQSDCKTTEPGYYNPVDGQPHPKMDPCNNGTYQPAAGKAVCVVCDKGTFVPDDGQSHTEEIDCAKGMYADVKKLSACKTCKSGYYTNVTRTVECNAATPGWYVHDSDHTRQTVCDSGTFQPLAGRDKCDDTEPGYYVPDDNKPHTKPDPCAKGYYQPERIQVECIECATGNYTDELHQPACKVAEPGYFVPDDDHTHQRPCYDGKWQPQTGQNHCLITSRGYYSPDVAQPNDQQTPCPAGAHQNYTGMAQCDDCTMGRYTNVTAQPLCQVSSPGWFVKDGDHTKQVGCPAGSYQPDEETNACLDASDGYHVPMEKAIRQYPCYNGQYQPEHGKPACLDTTPGYFVPNDGQPHIYAQACDGGRFQPDAHASSCKYCPAETSTPDDDQPHKSCVRWVPVAPKIDAKDRMVIDSSAMNETVATVAFGKETNPCQLVQTADGNTTIIPVVTEPTVKAGTYPMKLTYSDGTAATINVNVPTDYTIPEARTSLKGVVMQTRVNSTICPASMTASLLGPTGLTAAEVADDGTAVCIAQQEIDAAIIKAKLIPEMEQSPTNVCAQLHDVTFNSTEQIGMLAAGVELAPYLDEFGRLCASTGAAHTAVAKGMDDKEDGVNYIYVTLDDDAFIRVQMDNYDPAPDSNGGSGPSMAVIVGGFLLIGAFVAVFIAAIGIIFFVVVAGAIHQHKTQDGLKKRVKVKYAKLED